MQVEPSRETQLGFTESRRSSLPYIVFALVALTTILAGLVVIPRLQPPRLRLDEEPDFAKPFGREMSWIAIRDGNAPEILEVLGIAQAAPVSWECGLGLIYSSEFADRFVFISPPVEGWTLVAGIGLPIPSSARFVDKLMPLLQRISRRFDEVQYFASHPAIDFYGWARLKAGAEPRGFAAGEAGIVWDIGTAALEERKIGAGSMEVRGIRDRVGDIGGGLILHPTEDHVFTLARLWSVNPMAQPPPTLRSTGWIAALPSAWKVERVTKAA